MLNKTAIVFHTCRFWHDVTAGVIEAAAGVGSAGHPALRAVPGHPALRPERCSLSLPLRCPTTVFPLSFHCPFAALSLSFHCPSTSLPPPFHRGSAGQLSCKGTYAERCKTQDAAFVSLCVPLQFFSLRQALPFCHGGPQVQDRDLPDMEERWEMQVRSRVNLFAFALHVSIAFAATTLPLLCVFPLPSWPRHRVCLVCSHCLRR